MRKLTAFKHELGSEPYQSMMLENNRAVFHKIEVLDAVNTPSGIMTAAKIRQKVDLADPDIDVAALVGHVKKFRKSGKVDPQSPELWWWNDKFWLKAVDSSGATYYTKKTYVIYEVQIQNPDAILGSLTHGFQD